MNCVICTKPRESVYGLMCVAHFERLARMLRDIETEAYMLDARPSMAQVVGSGKGGLASERAPARLDVLVHTDRRRGTGRSETDDDANAAGNTLPILDVFHSWARIVREERDLQPPQHVSISGERELLTRHLEWIAEQAWVDEAYTDVRQLLGQLKGVNGTADEKPVGRCYLPDDAGQCTKQDGICCGPIWIDTANGHAHCGRCRQTWDGPQLAVLSFELEQARIEAARPRTEDGRRMLTVDELAKKLKTSVNNVRVMAHRKRLVSQDGHYDPEQFRVKATA